MFKINNKDNRTRQWHLSGVFIVNFKYISQVVVFVCVCVCVCVCFYCLLWTGKYLLGVFVFMTNHLNKHEYLNKKMLKCRKNIWFRRHTKNFKFQTIPETIFRNKHFKQNRIPLSKTDYLLNVSFWKAICNVIFIYFCCHKTHCQTYEHFLELLILRAPFFMDHLRWQLLKTDLKVSR